MSLTTGILVIVILLLISIRTISFAVWNWKHDNKPGSIMVVLVCLATLALPVYMVFFKT